MADLEHCPESGWSIHDLIAKPGIISSEAREELREVRENRDDQGNRHSAAIRGRDPANLDHFARNVERYIAEEIRGHLISGDIVVRGCQGPAGAQVEISADQWSGLRHFDIAKGRAAETLESPSADTFFALRFFPRPETWPHAYAAFGQTLSAALRERVEPRRREKVIDSLKAARANRRHWRRFDDAADDPLQALMAEAWPNLYAELQSGTMIAFGRPSIFGDQVEIESWRWHDLRLINGDGSLPPASNITRSADIARAAVRFAPDPNEGFTCLRLFASDALPSRPSPASPATQPPAPDSHPRAATGNRKKSRTGRPPYDYIEELQELIATIHQCGNDVLRKNGSLRRVTKSDIVRVLLAAQGRPIDGEKKWEESVISERCFFLDKYLNETRANPLVRFEQYNGRSRLNFHLLDFAAAKMLEGSIQLNDIEQFREIIKRCLQEFAASEVIRGRFDLPAPEDDAGLHSIISKFIEDMTTIRTYLSTEPPAIYPFNWSGEREPSNKAKRPNRSMSQ